MAKNVRGWGLIIGVATRVAKFATKVAGRALVLCAKLTVLALQRDFAPICTCTRC